MEEKKIECLVKALVVDDFQTTRKSLKLILRALNFLHIEEAADGKEALRLVEEDSKIGLILLDWNMPKMSGLSLLKEIRKSPEKKRIKVIMITAESLSANILSAIQAGADEYIIKPVTGDILKDKIHKMVKKDVAAAKKIINEKIQNLKKRETSMQSDLRSVLWESVRELKSSFSYFPWVADPHYEMGMLFQELGELNKAADEFEKSLTVDERHTRASVALGNIYLKRKQGKKALRVLEVVAARRPSTDVLQALGEAYLDTGNANKAITTFKKSIQLVEAVQKGKMQQAEAESMAEKHEGLGMAYLSKFDETKEKEWNEKSVESFNNALKYNHRYISAHFNLMTAYKNAGDSAKVREILQKVSEITPNDTSGWLKLGNTYLDQKSTDKAAFSFKRAMGLSTYLPQTYFEIGNIFIDHDLDMALKFLNKSIDLEEKQAHVLNKIGIIYRRKGKHQDAITNYQKALVIEPNDEYILYNAASAYLESEQTEEAIKCLEKAIEVAPNFTTAAKLLQSVKKIKGIE